MEKKLVNDLLYKDECYKIIGFCIKIHNKLGKGFKEIVYKDALELKNEGILFEREKLFNVSYDQNILQHKFYADFFVFNCIILEIKAVSFFHPLFYSDFKLFESFQCIIGDSYKFWRGKFKVQKNSMQSLESLNIH